jgi:hypothetical protein
MGFHCQEKISKNKVLSHAVAVFSIIDEIVYSIKIRLDMFAHPEGMINVFCV